MSVYLRGKTWWYKFYFGSRLIRQSTKTHLKTLAKQAEAQHRRALEMGFNGLSEDNRHERIQTFTEAAKTYMETYARHRPRSVRFISGALKHITEHLGTRMLVEITDAVVVGYQTTRLKEGASGKTINDEVGVLLRVMGDPGEMLRLRFAKVRN